LSVALRRYWRNLIGLATFPAASILGIQYLHLPPLLSIPMFIAACLHALWPVRAKRAPYTFWLVAGVVYLGGAIFTAVAFILISDMHKRWLVHQLLSRPPP
jgi:hypothetical protein